jgi:hypothetical protein
VDNWASQRDPIRIGIPVSSQRGETGIKKILTKNPSHNSWWDHTGIASRWDPSDIFYGACMEYFSTPEQPVYKYFNINFTIF